MNASSARQGRYAFRTDAALGLEGPEALALWEHGSRAVSEADGKVVGYFDERVPLPLEGTWEELDDVDYLERYYQGLEAVRVGPMVIAPTHRNVQLKAGQKVLWIDPGMAFGTGHHETTQLAIEALSELDLTGKNVLDVGSGSGILAIAADLLGASAAVGIDIDPDTVPVAKENAALNRSRARFKHGELGERDKAQVLVANLYAELHVELAGAYAEAVPRGGDILLTGILAQRSEPVERALEEEFEEIEWRARNEWKLLKGRRK